LKLMGFVLFVLSIISSYMVIVVIDELNI
jgi:hypothetical protein